MLHFQHFKKDISGIQVPDKFTFPFYYEPHPLTLVATKELQEYLEKQTDFKHEFGLKDAELKNAIGKMFGILVVKKADNSLGYLAAYSGKLADNSFPDKFVPPIFNMRSEGSFYLEGEKKTDLEGHLKNQDFFEVEKFPTGHFEIVKVEEMAIENATHKITGNLTLKGITKSVEFPIKIKFTLNGVFVS